MTGRLVVALTLTSFFVAGEFVAGLLSHSLALISDAGHNLTDALAVGFSLWAIRISRQTPTPGKTFGYRRAGVLAAALNAATLVLIALFIFYEGIRRLVQPEQVQGWPVVIVAVIAALLNAFIAFSLKAGAEDLNVRSAFVHMLGDAVSAVGVIIAGIGILLIGWQALDPLVSFVIALFILWSSWSILKEVVNILMEGTPVGLNLANVIADMTAVPSVESVHDVHVWTIGQDMLALSGHVKTSNCRVSEASQVIADVNRVLESKYHIVHSTLQPECDECDPNEQYCSLHVDKA